MGKAGSVIQHRTFGSFCMLKGRTDTVAVTVNLKVLDIDSLPKIDSNIFHNYSRTSVIFSVTQICSDLPDLSINERLWIQGLNACFLGMQSGADYWEKQT